MSRRRFLEQGGSAGLGLMFFPFASGCGKEIPDTDTDPDTNPDTTPSEVKIGDVFPAWSEGYLDIHAINTGRGEATLYIFPDGTTMLVDASGSLGGPDVDPPLTPAKPNGNVTSGEVIANYCKHYIAAASNKLNYIVLTHYHNDHIGGYSSASPLVSDGSFRLCGLTEVGAKIHFDKLIDRDYPDFQYKTSDMSDSNVMSNYKQFLEWSKTNYGATIEQFVAGRNDQIVLKQNASAYPGFKIQNLAVNGKVWAGSGTGVKNTFPELAEWLALGSSGPAENICSIAFRLTYGKFKYFAGGDLQYNGKSTYAWKDIETPVAQVTGEVDVMKANHHSTSNCNGEVFLQKLNPRTILIHTWRDVQPNLDTIKRMLALPISPQIFASNMTDANKERLKTVISEFKSMQGHTVVRVQPGGGSYSVYTLDDSDQLYNVKKIFGPYGSKA
ncbi:MAG: MBL fold metallo-hydrolase [Dysgonamonadaceae bacterium]|nr:MBL fold metallo-hydrolase [Dysgonamonadaceae bacterium]